MSLKVSLTSLDVNANRDFWRFSRLVLASVKGIQLEDSQTLNVATSSQPRNAAAPAQHLILIMLWDQ